jgi:hypothetical protein
LGVTILYRAKLNWTPRQSENFKQGLYHCDFEIPCKTTVYYMNTNNGYTSFEDSDVVFHSEENTSITFPSHLKHVGNNCTDSEYRIVLNLNYV